MLQSAALGLRRKNLPCTSRHRRDLPRLGRRGKAPCCREPLQSPPLSSQPTFCNPLQSRRLLWLLQSLPRSVDGLWRSAKLCAGLRVRGGSVLSARSVAVLAILSASCLVFLVGFRLTTTLTFSLSTSLLYTIAQVHSICKLHKDIHLHKYKLYTCASTDCVL